MTEDQTIEYKAIWRDECLKWICRFANAQGGVLEIGKDDRGRVVGLADAAKLLEDLPNKIRDILGIVPEVDRLIENGKDYLRITVQPYPNPISYKGQYHVRSGSTKQELKGSALDHFLLGKYGRRWDGVPLPGVKPSDLDASLLERFRRRAVQSRRLNAEDLPTDDTALLDMLRLTEGNYLKRAAVLLFHPDPERFITGTPIQIRVYDDRILIWNSGTLPDNWTAERLKAKHPSKPFNPDVANVFFRAGTIEAWGRGIERMCADCTAHGVPEPVLQCEPDGMWVEFANRTVESQSTTQIVEDESAQNTADRILAILRVEPTLGRRAIAEKLGDITEDGVKYHLEKLRSQGRIRHVGPDKGGRWEVLDGGTID